MILLFLTRARQRASSCFSPADASDKATITAPRRNDIFTWKNINYTVLSMEEIVSSCRTFLDTFPPVNLLHSWASREQLLNVLAMRTDTGMVTGDRFVNGH